MISIAALVNKWRQDDGNTDVYDTPSILILNACSLESGCIANISLVLNFSQRLNYKISQYISITGFMTASVLLLIAILLAHFLSFDKGDFTKAEGFWFAVLTVILYALCSLTCVLNFLGYKLKKYPAKFNLQFSERGLIAYTFILAVWFLWGAAMFSQLLHLSYGDGMYYCVISLLTIGLGDITPNTNVTKGLALVYSLSGVIILGLIIAMIRGVIVSSSAPVYFWNRVETDRKKIFKKIQENETKLTSEESFELIRSIRKCARRKGENTSTLVTIIVFVGFWLIGALVLKFTENWNYFDAVYFCFLCLLTIGYGDFAPKSAAGRAFFIVWALGAVPLMTALISNIGDTIFNIAQYGMSLKIFKTIFSRSNKFDEEDLFEKLNEKTYDNSETRSIDDIMSEASHHTIKSRKKSHTKKLMKSLKRLIIEAKDNPQKKYGFEEWSRMMQLLEIEDDDGEFSNGLFWISERSPLSFPISEPNYMLFLLFNRLETKFMDEMDIIDEIISSG